MILISGWAADRNIWQPVEACSRRLRNAEYQEWWENMHGELARRIAGYSEPVILAGWSMGGQIALQTAAAHPDRVAGVITVSSMCCLTGNEDRPGIEPGLPAEMKKVLLRNRDAFLQAFFSNCRSPETADTLAGDIWGDSGAIKTDHLMDGLDYMVRTLADPPPGIPLLAVHGRKDAIIPWQCSKYMTRNRIRARTIFFRNAGHLLPFTEPERLGRLFDEFLQKRYPG